MAKKQEIQDKRFELYERAHTREYYAVAKWLSEVSFNPAVIGVDPVDVWRKMEKLCELYEAAIDAERARNAKLERKLRSITAAKRTESQGKPEQPKAAPAPQVSDVPKAPAPRPEPVPEAPQAVQAQVADSVAQVMKEAPAATEAPKPSNPEEEILMDLLREFGPEKGGKANG